MSGEPTGPVDLRELAREIGREESLAKRTEGLQLITFAKNPEKSRSDPIGRHPVNGRIVFPDKRRLGATIKAGETYFCDLEEYQPADGLPVYYANPVMRIDASYLFDLRRDQIAKIVDALAATAMSQLMDQARAQIRKQLEDQFKVEFESVARGMPQKPRLTGCALSSKRGRTPMSLSGSRLRTLANACGISRARAKAS